MQVINKKIMLCYYKIRAVNKKKNLIYILKGYNKNRLGMFQQQIENRYRLLCIAKLYNNK
jgi:hypothetical protein